MSMEYFGFIVDRFGKKYYFTKEQRTQLEHRLPSAQWDSHSYIAMYYKVNVDKVNKYWYTKEEGLIETQLNVSSSLTTIKLWTKTEAFKSIIKELL